MQQNLPENGIDKGARLTGVSFGATLLCGVADQAGLVVGDGSRDAASELAYGFPGVQPLEWNQLDGSGKSRFVIMSFPSQDVAEPIGSLQKGLESLEEDGDAIIILNRRKKGLMPKPTSPGWKEMLGKTGFHVLGRYILRPDACAPSVMLPRDATVVREACSSGLVSVPRIINSFPVGLQARLLTGKLSDPFLPKDEIIHLGRKTTGRPNRIPGPVLEGADPDRDYRILVLNPPGIGKMTVFLVDPSTGESLYLRRVLIRKHPIYSLVRKDIDHLIQLEQLVGDDQELAASLPTVGREIRKGDLRVIPQKLIKGTPLYWKIKQSGEAWTEEMSCKATEKVMQWCLRLHLRTPPSVPENMPRLDPDMLKATSGIPDELAEYENTGMEREWLQHGDLSCRNVFFQKEDNSVAVIDWDRMAIGLPPMFDYFSFVSSMARVQNRYEELMYGVGLLQEKLKGIYLTELRRFGLDPAAGPMWYLRFLWVKNNTSIYLARLHGVEDGNLEKGPKWILNHTRTYKQRLAMHLERHNDFIYSCRR